MDAGLFINLGAALVLPFGIGLVILIFLGGHRYGTLAGLFTLKPILATPLMMPMVVPWLLFPSATTAALLVVPGIVLTLIILRSFRQLYRPFSAVPYVLLLGDVLRWLSTFLIFVLLSEDPKPYFPIGYILPSVYAIMALIIVLLQPKLLPAPSSTEAVST